MTTALDITDRKATETHLHYIAHHDSLTGLANRTALMARLRMEAARARRGERAFALHLVDLDRFKTINDVHGHAAGDALLEKWGPASPASRSRARWWPDSAATSSR